MLRVKVFAENKDEFETAHVPGGTTIREYIESTGADKELQSYITIYRYGLVIEDWDQPFADKDEIHIAPGAVGGALLVGALTSGLTYAAAPAALTGLALGATVAGTGLLAAASYYFSMAALGKLNDLGGGSTSEAYSLTGSQNKARPYEAIPVVLGRQRVVPDLAAQPYTETQGDDVYLRQLFCLGHGPLNVVTPDIDGESFKIGDTPITSFDDVEFEVRDYFNNTDDITLFPFEFQQERIGVELVENDVDEWIPPNVSDYPDFIERQLGEGAKELAFEFQFPQGLTLIGNNGSRYSEEGSFQLEISKDNNTTYKTAILADLGGAPGEPKPFNKNLVVGEDNSRKYYGTYLEGGNTIITVDPISDPNFLDRISRAFSQSIRRGDIVYDNADGNYYIFKGTEITGETRNPSQHPDDYEKIVIEEITKEGVTIIQKPTFPVVKSWFWWPGDPGKVDGFFRGFRFSVDEGQYFVRARKTDFVKYYKYDAAQVQNRLNWVTATAIKNVPDIHDTGFVFIALRAKATNQLNGTIDEFSCIAESVVPEWTETNWDDSAPILDETLITKEGERIDEASVRRILKTGFDNPDWQAKTLTPTRNPAELMRWLLQGPMNRRPLPDSRIDLDGLNTFRDWCIQEGFTCDYIIDRESTLFDQLQNIAYTGRAQFTFKDGKYSAVIDGPKPPTQLFSDKNTRGFSSSRDYNEIVDGYLVRFQNEDKDYEDDEIRLIVDKDTYGTKFETLELLGIVNPDIAYRFGRFLRAERELRRETYQIEADIEAIRCSKGDRVLYQNKVLLIGQTAGRIVSVTNGGATLLLDENVQMESGKSYRIAFRSGEDLFTADVVTEVGKTREIDLVSANGDIAAGDLFAFGEETKETLDLIVDSISYDNELAATLTCRNYAEQLYTIDEGTIPEFESGITKPPGELVPLAAPTIESVRVIDSRIRSVRGEVEYAIELSIGLPPSRFLEGVRLEVQYVDPRGDIVKLAPTKDFNRTLVIRNLSEGIHTFRARFTKDSKVSEYGELTFNVQKEQNGVPPPVPDVTGLELFGQNANGTEFTGREINFRWRRASFTILEELGSESFGADSGSVDDSVEAYFVVIRDPNDNNRIVREEETKDTEYTYSYDMNLEDGGPRRKITIEVYTLGRENQLSQRPAKLTVENPAPQLPNQVEVFPYFSQFEVFFDRPEDDDFDKAKLWVDTNNPPARNSDTLEYEGNDTTPIAVTGLDATTNYYFQIELYDDFGPGELSEVFSVTTGFIPEQDDEPPTVPGDPTITSIVREAKLYTSGQIDVEWLPSTDNSGLLYYEIEYWVNSNERTRDSTVEPNFTVFPAEVGVAYNFRVRAIDYSGNASAWSSTIQHTINGDVDAPAEVANFSAVGGFEKVILTYDTPSDEDLVAVKIYRDTTSPVTIGATNFLAEFPTQRQDTFKYIDSEIVNGTTYYYAITTVDVSRNESSGVQSLAATPFKFDFENIDDYVEPQTINSRELVDLSVLESKLADAAVSVNKIQDSAVQETKISDNAISTPKLQANSIIAGKIASGEIAARLIQTAELNAANIAAGAIQANAIQADRLNVNQLSAISADIGNITAGTLTGTVVRTSTLNPRVQLDSTNGISVFNSGGAVTTRFRTNGSGYVGLIGGSPAITFDINGTVSVPGTLVASGIDAGNITVGTLNADRIGVNTIEAEKLNVTQLSAISVDAGTITAGIFEGPTFRTSTTGARVQIDTSQGIRTFNSSGGATAQLDLDGSGYIGIGGNVLSWDVNGNLTAPGGILSGGVIESPLFRAKTPGSSWWVELGPKAEVDGTNVFRYTNGSSNKVEIDELGNVTLTEVIFTSNSGTGGKIEILPFPSTDGLLRAVDSSGNTRFQATGAGSGFIGGPTASDSFLQWTSSGVGTLRTQSSGERIEIQGGNNSLRFFNSSGTNVVTLTTQAVSDPDEGLIDTYFLVDSSSVIDVAPVYLKSDYGSGPANILFNDNTAGRTLDVKGSFIAGLFQASNSSGFDISCAASHETGGGHIVTSVSTTNTGTPSWPASEGTLLVRRGGSNGRAKIWLQEGPGSASNWREVALV